MCSFRYASVILSEWSHLSAICESNVAHGAYETEEITFTYESEPFSTDIPEPSVLRSEAARFANKNAQPDTSYLWTRTLTLPMASVVPSPSISNNGSMIFYTADWGAARSTNGGLSWTYINASSYQGSLKFCCQQDTVFDPTTGLFIWLMTMDFGTGTTLSGYRIGTSDDLVTWTFMTLSLTQMTFPQTVYYAVSTQMQLTGENLWISANLGSGYNVVYSAIMKVLHVALL